MKTRAAPRLKRTILLAFVPFFVFSGCGRSYGQQACRMENERVLAESKGIPTSVAVIASNSEGFQVAWASDGATWVSNLDALGNPVGTPVKIKRQNSGQITVLPEEGEAKTFWPKEDRSSITAENLSLLKLDNDKRLLLILEQPAPNRTGGVFAAAYDASLTSEPRVVKLAPAGEYSGRIASAARGDSVIVAWHDGRLDSSNIRIVGLNKDSLETESETVLSSENPIHSPSLAVIGDACYLVWSEIIEENAKQKSTVNLALVTQDLQIKNQVTVHKGFFVDNEPELAVAGERLGLAYRDDEDGDGTLEYHFALLDSEGNPVGPAKRISQADGWRGPRMAFLDTRFVATTIRSFQRNLLIGLNQFDLQGVKLSGEFQVYADKTDFVRVDLDAIDDSVVMIYAEDRRDSGRILSARIICQRDI